jgi:hypothetical protein
MTKQSKSKSSILSSEFKTIPTINSKLINDAAKKIQKIYRHLYVNSKSKKSKYDNQYFSEK